MNRYMQVGDKFEVVQYANGNDAETTIFHGKITKIERIENPDTFNKITLEFEEYPNMTIDLHRLGLSGLSMDIPTEEQWKKPYNPAYPSEGYGETWRSWIEPEGLEPLMTVLDNASEQYLNPHGKPQMQCGGSSS